MDKNRVAVFLFSLHSAADPYTGLPCNPSIRVSGGAADPDSGSFQSDPDFYKLGPGSGFL